MLIAPPAAPALSDQDPLAVVHQLRDQLASVLVANHGTDRQLDGDVVAVHAGAVRAHAVLAAFRFPLALKLEVIEGVEALRCFDEHGAAIAAVAA